jgi:hypothetical protein
MSDMEIGALRKKLASRRWRLTWNLFAIYQPASSSVGMFQMTDAAFAEA